MGFGDALDDSLPFILSLLLATVGGALVFTLLKRMLIARRRGADPGRDVRRQVIRLLLSVMLLIAFMLALSVNPHTEQSATLLAGILGIVVSAAITISSATFIANAMAGLMLRAVRNFRMGDYIRVGDQFGRVSERGLFHVEIQTEDRDLATLPNLYLVTQPVTVVRASGTIVSTKVSLGYDVRHTRVEKALEQAARDAELEDPFVYILELGDYSITYRIGAFLPEVKHLLSARSRLRKCVLDALHADEIEIVSPVFMNQRRLSEEAVIAPPERRPAARTSEEPAPEDLMFDKAENAEQRALVDSLALKITDLEGQLATANDPQRGELEAEIQQLREQRESIERSLGDATEPGES